MDDDDLASIRQWRDEHADPMLRHRAMAAETASLWESIDGLLREVDRRINPDELDDEQVGIYEAGYVAGQHAVAQRLRAVAAEVESVAESPRPQGDE